MQTEPSTHAESPLKTALRDFVWRAQLAEELGVTVRTLELWAHKRKGPPVTIVGGRACYHREDVATWLDSLRNRDDRAPRRRKVAT